MLGSGAEDRHPVGMKILGYYLHIQYSPITPT